ncbi:GYF domain-containing protein [Cryptosporidium muris RN66]|uniref:GYF domain-containing protein n=1 Tax=Cryptosporidium muris (strain RN66) TaxID=441375 RepID=B6AG90_CRYMR|nr:GYF domain-containing protein [Cryptosporidium muris RN66]EEA07231.1 GYF domain-containing protein [Cryptosporidium muris RN66]|eukprot:XP_002141580.1 GYF domain-containing protein [Cryptosporidium muris RN66]
MSEDYTYGDIIDVEFIIKSIAICIKEETSKIKSQFLVEINIEPGFFNENLYSNINFNSEDAKELFEESYIDSNDDNKSNIQFKTDWFDSLEKPTFESLDLFYSDVSGNIKECAMNFKMKCSIILPQWITKTAKAIYSKLEKKEDFNEFLLSNLRMVITVWYNNKEKEISSISAKEIGYCSICLSDPLMLSPNAFYFLTSTQDDNFLYLDQNLMSINDKCTNGIIRGMLTYYPRIIHNNRKFNNTKEKYFMNIPNNQSKINNMRSDKQNIISTSKKHKIKEKLKRSINELMKDNLSYNMNSTSNIYTEDYSIYHCIPLMWEYIDDDGNIQGPYNSIVIMSWIIKDYFEEDRLFRLCVNTHEDHPYTSHISFESIKYENNWAKLSEYIDIIKADVIRMFPIPNKYASISMKNNFEEKNLYKENNNISEEQIKSDIQIRYKNKIINDDLKPSLNHFQKNEKDTINTNFNFLDSNDELYSKFHLKRNTPEFIEAIKLLKNKIERITSESFKQFKDNHNKEFVSDNTGNFVKEQDINIFSNINLNRVNLNKVDDPIIEDIEKSIFDRSNNEVIKQWCVKYGSRMVIEACVIRIQSAYRNYLRKKQV